MEMQEPFFTLTHEEASGISKFCVDIIHDLRQRDKLPSNISGEIFSKMLEALYNKFTAVNDKLHNDIVLDMSETITLQIVIAYTLEFFDSFAKMSGEESESKEIDEEIMRAFEYLKEETPSLMWRLTEALDFNTLGIDSLENILHIKTGVVRPLNVDNKEIVTSITIDKINAVSLKVIFNLIDTLEYFKNDYNFAKNVYQSRYINLSDYKTVRDKIMGNALPGNKILLTLFDNIILYWSTSIAQYIFISDTADIFDNLKDRFTPEIFRKVRSFYFRYNDLLLSEMKDRLHDNETFKQYCEQVKKWDL